MHRISIASAAAALLCVTAVSGFAAPMTPTAPAATSSPLTLVQGSGPGWWEQENRGDAPQRYWQLQRRDHGRYDRLQAEIDQLRQQRAQIDARIQQDIAEQHRILHFER